MSHSIRRTYDIADPENETLRCTKCGAVARAIDREPHLLMLGFRFLEWREPKSGHVWVSNERAPWWECEESNAEATANQ